MDTERPKARLCLKLGQKKLCFQQQKLQAASKPQEVSSNTDTHTESTPPDNNTSSTSLTDELAGCSAYSRELPPLSGLCNLGNTCYVNCLLQPLRFCPQFSQWVGELHSLCEQMASKSGSTSCKKTEINPKENDRSSMNGVLADEEGAAMEISEMEGEKTPSIGLTTHLHNVSIL